MGVSEPTAVCFEPASDSDLVSIDRLLECAGVLIVAFFASAPFAGIATSPLGFKQPTVLAGLGSCPQRATPRVLHAEGKHRYTPAVVGRHASAFLKFS